MEWAGTKPETGFNENQKVGTEEGKTGEKLERKVRKNRSKNNGKNFGGSKSSERDFKKKQGLEQ